MSFFTNFHFSILEPLRMPHAHRQEIMTIISSHGGYFHYSQTKSVTFLVCRNESVLGVDETVCLRKNEHTTMLTLEELKALVRYCHEEKIECLSVGGSVSLNRAVTQVTKDRVIIRDYMTLGNQKSDRTKEIDCSKPCFLDEPFSTRECSPISTTHCGSQGETTLCVNTKSSILEVLPFDASVDSNGVSLSSLPNSGRMSGSVDDEERSMLLDIHSRHRTRRKRQTVNCRQFWEGFQVYTPPPPPPIRYRRIRYVQTRPSPRQSKGCSTNVFHAKVCARCKKGQSKLEKEGWTIKISHVTTRPKAKAPKVQSNQLDVQILGARDDENIFPLFFRHDVVWSYCRSFREPPSEWARRHKPVHKEWRKLTTCFEGISLSKSISAVRRQVRNSLEPAQASEREDSVVVRYSCTTPRKRYEIYLAAQKHAEMKRTNRKRWGCSWASGATRNPNVWSSWVAPWKNVTLTARKDMSVLLEDSKRWPYSDIYSAYDCEEGADEELEQGYQQLLKKREAQRRRLLCASSSHASAQLAVGQGLSSKFSPSGFSDSAAAGGSSGKLQSDVSQLAFDVGNLEYAFSFASQSEHNVAFAAEVAAEAGVRFPPPKEWLRRKLHAEWAGSENGVAATKAHYEYVLGPAVEVGDRDVGHGGMTLCDFLGHARAVEAKLSEPEVLALRLYTGPAYALLNGSLRRRCGAGECFPVTSYCLQCAIIKLAQFVPKLDSVRGIRGAMPAKFVEAYESGRKLRHGDAISESAFMSTTTNLSVALAGQYSGATLFVIRGRKHRPTYLRGGAPVSWVSQFPREQEVLFPCNTELWYVLPDKRDLKQPWYATSTSAHRALRSKNVYEFTVRCYFDARRLGPMVPGFPSTAE